MNTKKVLKTVSVMLLVILTAFFAASCGQPENEESEPVDYEIGFVITGSTIEENPVENDIWQSVIEYGENNGNSHRYYVPETQDQDAYRDCVRSAVSDGVKVILTQGTEMASIISSVQKKYQDVNFIHIQGSMDSRNEGKGDLVPATNTLKISFREEQAGFLAGYGCVKNENWDLAVIGCKDNKASRNYAAGFIQGAETAADEMGVSDVKIRCRMFSKSKNMSGKAKRLAARLYRKGTEVIFVCEPSCDLSVSRAAENNDGEFICVEHDPGEEYEEILTTAARDYSGAVNYALTKHFDNKFPGGKTMRMGAQRDSVMLDMEDSEFEEFTESQYERIYSRISSGSVKVRKAPSNMKKLKLEIVSLLMI